MKNLTEVTANEIAMDIINDAILFERMIKPMQSLMDVYSVKGGTDWDAQYHYNGIASAYKVLGLSGDTESELTQNLLDKFFQYMKKDADTPINERPTSNELAKSIFNNWQTVIKNQALQVQN